MTKPRKYPREKYFEILIDDVRACETAERLKAYQNPAYVDERRGRIYKRNRIKTHKMAWNKLTNKVVEE